MAEFDPNLPEEQEEKPSYTPASFEKRTAAWAGIAYVLMVLFIITYSIYTGGGTLAGTFPLFLVPAAVAVMVIAIHRQRMGTAPGGLPMTIVVVVIALCAVAFALMLGIPAVAAAFHSPLAG